MNNSDISVKIRWCLWWDNNNQLRLSHTLIHT